MLPGLLTRLFESLFSAVPPHKEVPKPRVIVLPWSVEPDTGKLVICGQVQDPCHQWSRSDLEQRLKQLNERIKDSGRPLAVVAICIERHVAGGLWNEGTLTAEMLGQATHEYGGLTFRLELLGSEYPVSIQHENLCADCEFIVSGHPGGALRVHSFTGLAV